MLKNTHSPISVQALVRLENTTDPVQSAELDSTQKSLIHDPYSEICLWCTHLAGDMFWNILSGSFAGVFQEIQTTCLSGDLT